MTKFDDMELAVAEIAEAAEWVIASGGGDSPGGDVLRRAAHAVLLMQRDGHVLPLNPLDEAAAAATVAMCFASKKAMGVGG